MAPGMPRGMGVIRAARLPQSAPASVGHRAGRRKEGRERGAVSWLRLGIGSAAVCVPLRELLLDLFQSADHSALAALGIGGDLFQVVTLEPQFEHPTRKRLEPPHALL